MPRLCQAPPPVTFSLVVVVLLLLLLLILVPSPRSVPKRKRWWMGLGGIEAKLILGKGLERDTNLARMRDFQCPAGRGFSVPRKKLILGTGLEGLGFSVPRRKSCLATSMTTALSFYANLVSVLQPLREFGPPAGGVRADWRAASGERLNDHRHRHERLCMAATTA